MPIIADNRNGPLRLVLKTLSYNASDVHRAEFRVGGLGQRVALIPHADIGRDRQCLAPEPFTHLIGELLAVVEFATGDDHIGAILGERQNHFAAKSTAAPTDEGNLPGQIDVGHLRVLSR